MPTYILDLLLSFRKINFRQTILLASTNRNILFIRIRYTREREYRVENDI